MFLSLTPSVHRTTGMRPGQPPRTSSLAALALVAGLGVGLAGPAQAGRPLATDDAETAPAGSCQVEGWAEKAGADRGWVLAPACGVAPGLEINGSLTRFTASALSAEGELGAKWSPHAAHLHTPLGELRLGARLSLGSERQPAGGWVRTRTSALGLASLVISDAWSVHANLGMQRDEVSLDRAALGRLALVWSPNEWWQVALETQRSRSRTIFGNPEHGIALRRWLMKDHLALDVTASHPVGDGVHWSAGFGWYSGE